MDPNKIHNGTVVRIDDECPNTKQRLGWDSTMDNFKGKIKIVLSIKFNPHLNTYRVETTDTFPYVWHPDDLTEVIIRDPTELKKSVLFNELEIVGDIE